MKAPPVPWTADDEAIAFRRGRGYWATTLRASSLQADIRAADMMSWLTLFGRRHYGRMPYLPKAAQLPVVHLWLRIDPDWPAGHYLIDLTGDV